MPSECFSLESIQNTANAALDAMSKAGVSSIHEYGMVLGMLVEHYKQTVKNPCTDAEAENLVLECIQRGRDAYRASVLGEEVENVVLAHSKPEDKGVN